MFALDELKQRPIYRFGKCMNCGKAVVKESKYINYCDICAMLKKLKESK